MQFAPTLQFTPGLATLLASYAIPLQTKGECVQFERDAMVRAFPDLGENDAYEWTLLLVQEWLTTQHPQARAYWSGRTDDYLGLEVYIPV